MLSARNNRYSPRAAGVARGAAMSSLGKRKAAEFSPPSTPRADAVDGRHLVKSLSSNPGDMGLGVLGSKNAVMTVYYDYLAHENLDPKLLGEYIVKPSTQLVQDQTVSLPAERDAKMVELKQICEAKFSLVDEKKALTAEWEVARDESIALATLDERKVAIAKLHAVTAQIRDKDARINDFDEKIDHITYVDLPLIDAKFAVVEYALDEDHPKAYHLWPLAEIRDDIKVQTQGIAKELSGQEALGKLHTLKNMGLHGRTHRGDVKIEVPTGNATAEVHIANLIKVLEIPAKENKDDENEVDEAELALLKRQTEELMAKMSAKKSAKKARRSY